MAAKKKTTKKAAAKPAKTAKASKSAKSASRASASQVEETNNVQTLADAGVIDPDQLSSAEEAAINGKLSASDIETMISVFGKLGGTPKTRARVQLCF